MKCSLSHSRIVSGGVPLRRVGALGAYENVCAGIRILPHGDGIAIVTQLKHKIYETDTLEETPPEPMRPLGEDHFDLGDSGSLSFVNHDATGIPQHIAMHGRLYKRTT